MITEAIEAYRRCDPATGRIDDRLVVDSMLQRRLDPPAEHVGDDGSGSPRRHLLPAPQRRTVAAAGCVAALALGGLIMAIGDGGGDRPSGGEPESVASAASPTVTPTGAPVGDLLELRALATDAVADDFFDAVNSSSVDDALTLLSPRSDCHEPMLPDAAQETCGQYWGRQIAIGTEVSLFHCDGVAARRCSLLLRSVPTDFAGGERSLTGTVELRIDDEHRLDFGWVDRPADT